MYSHLQMYPYIIYAIYGRNLLSVSREETRKLQRFMNEGRRQSKQIAIGHQWHRWPEILTRDSHLSIIALRLRYQNFRKGRHEHHYHACSLCQMHIHLAPTMAHLGRFSHEFHNFDFSYNKDASHKKW